MSQTFSAAFSPAASPATGLGWPLTLGIAAIAGSLAGGCAMPFAALATLAAVTLPARPAIGAVLLMWLANQIFGFTLLGFPHDASTVAWGGVIGLATLGALVVARALTHGRTPGVLGLIGTLAAAFLGFQAGIFAFAGLLGLPCPVSLSVIAQVARNEAIGFALLYPLSILMRHVAPAWFAPRAARGIAG